MLFPPVAFKTEIDPSVFASWFTFLEDSSDVHLLGLSVGTVLVEACTLRNLPFVRC